VFGQRQKAGAVFGAVRRVQDLNSIQTVPDEEFHSLTCARRSRVGKDRQSSAFVHQLDSLGQVNSALVYVTGASVTQVLVESVSHIECPAILHQGSRHVRSPQRGVGRNREHIVERYPHADRVEAPHDLLGPVTSRFAKNLELTIHFLDAIDVQPQKVHFLGTLVGAQLDSRHESQSHTRGCGRGASDAIDRVMVCQRDRRQTGGVRFRYHRFGWICPVRCGGMEVKVHETGIAANRLCRRGH
jgi:hypothetical protein